MAFVSLGAGAVWSVVFVDFVPLWFERLPAPVCVALLLLPLAVHFLFGLLCTWWDWQQSLTYSLVVVGLQLAGSLLNEIAHTGNVSHLGPWYRQVIFNLLLLVVVWSAWLVGRVVQREQALSQDL